MTLPVEPRSTRTPHDRNKFARSTAHTRAMSRVVRGPGVSRVCVQRAFQALLAVLLPLVSARVCRAADSPGAPRWTGAVAAGTELPVSVGARAHIEAPIRLRLSTAVGVLPGPYVSAINGILVGAGAYDQSTATLIRETLSSSLVWRTHLGYRPFALHGFTVEAGYGLVALGGSASASSVVSAATGSAPPVEATGGKTFSVASTLHMLDVELGWEWRIVEHLFIRCAIGGAFTLGASTSVTPDYTPRAPRATESFTSASAAYLDETYTNYVFTPVVSLWSGYVW